LVISSTAVPSPSATTIRQRVAELCRSALVVPSRTTQASSVASSSGTCSSGISSAQRIPAASSTAVMLRSSASRSTVR
jgi:hypothetical protein